jgi:hypothetical protein
MSAPPPSPRPLDGVGVLREDLGLAPDEIAKLRNSGVIV